MIPDTALSAWHEAGHAVAYLSYRRRFRYITLHPRTAGVTAQVVVHPRRIDLLTRAVIAQAGPIAQGQYELSTRAPGELEAEGLEPEDVMFGAYLNGGHGDHEVIQEADDRISGAAAVSAQVARDILGRHWSAVERVAAALAERGALNYAEAVGLAQLEAS